MSLNVNHVLKWVDVLENVMNVTICHSLKKIVHVTDKSDWDFAIFIF